jgi:hypothetical protein
MHAGVPIENSAALDVELPGGLADDGDSRAAVHWASVNQASLRPSSSFSDEPMGLHSEKS